MDRADRLRRLKFRAWHRGTREADFLIGGFFDRHHPAWDDDAVALFEDLLEEQDVDILAWAMGVDEPPARFAGAMMEAIRRLDYIDIPR
jgi:antitoxin CptB